MHSFVGLVCEHPGEFPTLLQKDDAEWWTVGLN
jgi:hypothetical protein